MRVLERIEPGEVYGLTVQSFVVLSFEPPIMKGDVIGSGVPRVLEATRTVNPRVRFYRAWCPTAIAARTELIRAPPRPPYSASEAGRVSRPWVREMVCAE